MTGETHSNDDSDFLDDDFVVENLVDDHDELEKLFDQTEEQGEIVAGEASEEHDVLASGEDEDDLLFRDHTQGLVASETFESPGFEEEAASGWDGELLELDELADSLEKRDAQDAEEAEGYVTRAAGQQVDDAADDTTDDVGADLGVLGAEGFASAEDSADEPVDAAYSAAAEGEPVEADGGYPDAGEELAMDSEIDLEIVADDDLDDDLFADEEEPPVLSTPAAPVDEANAPLDAGLEALSALADDVPAGGAEPLDMLSGDADMDDLFEDANPASVFGQEEQGFSEGEGLLPDQAAYDELEEIVENGAGTDGDRFDVAQPVSEDAVVGHFGVEADEEEIEYDTSGYEDDEVYNEDLEHDEQAEAYAEEYHAEALERVDGHDIYAEEEAEEPFEVVGGAGSGLRRAWSIAFALAATILVFSGVAAVALRPAWFGLVAEVEQLAVIEVARPRVVVAVPEPPKVSVNRPEVASEPAIPVGSGQEESSPSAGAQTQPSVEQLPTVPGEAEESSPATGAPDAEAPGSTPSGAAPTTEPTAEQVAEQAAEVAAQEPAQGTGGAAVEVGGAGAATPSGPAVAAVDTPQPVAWPVPQAEVVEPSVQGEGLVRFGNGLMVGATSEAAPVARAVDGVVTGTRAFAQLHNGNYFVGRVKEIAAETITLKMEKGEITIATGAIAKLRRLGSKDYESLQRAKEGFVRLTNNNRLIGGILSEITDDHIVLEIRKNRVMLPKTAVGEIVDSQSPARVKLGITREEDEWLRGLAERALGGAVPARPGSKPPR